MGQMLPAACWRPSDALCFCLQEDEEEEPGTAYLVGQVRATS